MCIHSFIHSTSNNMFQDTVSKKRLVVIPSTGKVFVKRGDCLEGENGRMGWCLLAWGWMEGRGFRFLESLPVWRGWYYVLVEGIGRPRWSGQRREHGVLAGDAGRGQVSHSQGFDVYSRAVGHCGQFSGGEGWRQMCVLGSLPVFREAGSERVCQKAERPGKRLLEKSR